MKIENLYSRREAMGAILVAAGSLVTVGGCSKNPFTTPGLGSLTPSPVIQLAEYTVTNGVNGEPIITAPDGSMVSVEDLKRIYESSGSVGFNLAEVDPKSSTSRVIKPNWESSIAGLGYVFIGRHEDEVPHPLLPCVSNYVDHSHITIKRDKDTSNSSAWVHLHVGYTTGGCRRFVIFDSRNKWLCFATPPCPNFGQVRVVVEDILRQSLQSAGINPWPWILPSLAIVIAGLLMIVVLA